MRERLVSVTWAQDLVRVISVAFPDVLTMLPHQPAFRALRHASNNLAERARRSSSPIGRRCPVARACRRIDRKPPVPAGLIRWHPIFDKGATEVPTKGKIRSGVTLPPPHSPQIIPFLATKFLCHCCPTIHRTAIPRSLRPPHRALHPRHPQEFRAARTARDRRAPHKPTLAKNRPARDRDDAGVAALPVFASKPLRIRRVVPRTSRRASGCWRSTDPCAPTVALVSPPR
jgi:hypothetical protein